MNEDRRQSREPQPTHADYARADALRVRPCSHGYRSSGSCRECKAEAFAACRAEYEAKLAELAYQMIKSVRATADLWERRYLDERKHADELAEAMFTDVTVRAAAQAAHAARRNASLSQPDGCSKEETE